MMMTNRERQERGLMYRLDDDLINEMRGARRRLQALNTADWSDLETLRRLAKELLGKAEDALITPPFFCDYGSHIEVGKNFFANFNCTILDVAKVTIGDNCFMAPNVAIYTAGHSIHPETRNAGWEYGRPVTIGDNVWIGGSVVICPGVTIGSNVVIGAGSVVTKDIPDGVVAYGNPCHVVRPITEEDRCTYWQGQTMDSEAMAQMLGEMT